MLEDKNRLKRRSDFTRVYRRGKSTSCPAFVLYRFQRPGQGKEPRIGFSVSKKVGKAVARNQVRRRLQHAVRAELKRFCPGYDYVLVVRAAACQHSYAQLWRAIIKTTNFFCRN